MRQELINFISTLVVILHAYNWPKTHRVQFINMLEVCSLQSKTDNLTR